MIKTVLWDVDGTLLDFAPAEREAVRKTFRVFGLGECTAEMVSAYSRINASYWKRLETGELKKREVLSGRFRDLFALYGLNGPDPAEFNRVYQEKLGGEVFPFPGALETVRALKGRAVQCAVTNGTKRAQELKLEKSGLAALFDRVFISETAGYSKPDVRFFDFVMAELGHPAAGETLIVGDSLSGDVRGGANAGIRTCWFNPGGLPRSGPDVPDYEIAGIPEVLEIAEGRRK